MYICNTMIKKTENAKMSFSIDSMTRCSYFIFFFCEKKSIDRVFFNSYICILYLNFRGSFSNFFAILPSLSGIKRIVKFSRR